MQWHNRLHKYPTETMARKIKQKKPRDVAGGYSLNIPPAVAWQKAVSAYQNARPGEAMKYISPLLEHPSADGNTFLLAGIVESQLLNWRNAEPLLQKAVSIMPKSGDAWLALGSALQNLGQAEQALPSFQRVVELNPEDFQTLTSMGVAFEDMGRRLDALECYENALKLAPEFERALRRKAGLLGRLRRFEQACHTYELLLTRFADDLSLRLDYAELLEQANQPTKALAVVPDDIDSGDKMLIARAASLKAQVMIRQGEMDNALALLQETRKKTGKNFLRFREGGILDRMGRYDEAMRAFETANKAVRKQKNFLRVSRQEVFNYLEDKIKKGIDPGPGVNHTIEEQNNRLVFLVGLPRSGTTLLNRILNAHPEIQVLEELEALRSIETAVRDGASVSEARELYWEIVSQHVEIRANSVVIDKNPYHAMSLDVLPLVFPDANVIMILRHPYDSALSCFMQDFNPGPVNAQFLELPSCGKICARFLTLMAMYEKVCPNQVTRIHYENLVSNFREEVTGLLDVLKLSWHDDIDNYPDIASNSGPIMTASYEQVTRKLYSTAIQRWKNYTRWLEPFDKTLGPLLLQFGYEK